MTSDKKLNIKNVLGFVIPFGFTFLFLWLAFKGIDFKNTLSLLSNFSIYWFIIFYITYYLSHYFRALRWKFLLNSIKPNTKILNLLGATMIGYGVNSVIPRLGEVYRPSFLGKWEGISRTATLGTIVVERVIDLVVLGLSVLLSIYLYSGNLFKDILWLKSTLILGGIGMLGLIVFLWLVVSLKEKFTSVVEKIIGKISPKLASKVNYIMNMLIEGFAVIKSAKDFWAILILSIVIMLVYGLNAYLAFYVLGMNEIAEVSYATGWIVMSISAFGIVIPTVGGIGSYHAICIATLMLLGFNEDISAAYAIFTHTVSYLSFIFSTIFFVVFINHRRAKYEGAKKETFLSVFKSEGL